MEKRRRNSHWINCRMHRRIRSEPMRGLLTSWLQEVLRFITRIQSCRIGYAIFYLWNSSSAKELISFLIDKFSLKSRSFTFRSFAWAHALLSEAWKGSIPSRYRHGIGTEKALRRRFHSSPLGLFGAFLSYLFRCLVVLEQEWIALSSYWNLQGSLLCLSLFLAIGIPLSISRSRRLALAPSYRLVYELASCTSPASEGNWPMI